MNANDSAIVQADAAPVLPAPIPPQGKVSFVEYIRLMRDQHHRRIRAGSLRKLDIIERKILGRPRFIVNDPAAVKHVLLDNVANYEKTEGSRGAFWSPDSARAYSPRKAKPGRCTDEP